MPRHRHSEPATRPHPATPPRRLSPRRLHPPWHASAPGNRHARGRSPPRPRRHRPCRVSRRCCRRTARRPTSPPAASVFAIYAMDCLRQARDYRGERPGRQHRAQGTERPDDAAAPAGRAPQARGRQRHCRQDRLVRALRHRLDGRRAGARLARATPNRRRHRRRPRNPCPTRSPKRISMRSSTRSVPRSPPWRPAAAVRFRSPPPELVDAIVTGTGPALRALLVSPTGTRGIDEISAAEPHSRSEQRVGVS